MKQACTNR